MRQKVPSVTVNSDEKRMHNQAVRRIAGIFGMRLSKRKHRDKGGSAFRESNANAGIGVSREMKAIICCHVPSYDKS